MAHKLDRRTVLQGLAGVTLSLPWLEAMGAPETRTAPARFCALYTANGMSLPNPNHGISEWSWFPRTEGEGFEFGKSTEPLAPFRDQLSFLGGAPPSLGYQGRSAPLLRHVAHGGAAPQPQAGHVQQR
ncbi:MAG: DUF1552 domain-containing protein, partial [Planctomycetaceae bacterium]